MTDIPQVGQNASNFVVQDQNGNTVSLKDYQGHWLVLYFCPKDNTPGCTTEAKDFTTKIEKFNELEADILEVSPDSAKLHCKFIDKQELSLRLLSDPEHDVIEAYGAWRLKKYMGVVRSTFLISPERQIFRVWDKVRVRSRIENVLAELKCQLIKK